MGYLINPDNYAKIAMRVSVTLDDILEVDFLFHPTRHSLRHLNHNKLFNFPYYVCGMYKSNSNFGAGCPNWADWADLRFGFVHSTGIIEQNKVSIITRTPQLDWNQKVILKRHLVSMYPFLKITLLKITESA